MADKMRTGKGDIMTKNGGTGRYFRWQMGNGEN